MRYSAKRLEEVAVAVMEVRSDFVAFLTRYGRVYDATAQGWRPFVLWPAQVEAARVMQRERLLVVLKARQLGLSWLAVGYCLWTMLFYGPSTVLLFSLREAEAVELLVRLRGMYEQLPDWLQGRMVARSNMVQLANGSRAIAFSTRAGRGYTGTVAVVDEADYIPELNVFLNGVKPTIDAGGKLFLISTSDKRSPVSTFKSLFRAAVAGVGDYKAVFLPWSAHPGRDGEWYARTRAEMFAQRGTDDDFLAEYPATVEEALAPEELDRRLPASWVLPCVVSVPEVSLGLRLPGLEAWETAVEGVGYVIGVDPAEGNVHSDESVACVLRVDTWAQVAVLAARVDPGELARCVGLVAEYYNGADVLVERNNHGHSVLLALRERGTRLLAGYDGRAGWLSNVKGKPLMYDAAAVALRDRAVVVRDGPTAVQLCSIEASSLRAPAGLNDDRADAWALAIAALAYLQRGGGVSVLVESGDRLEGVDRDGWR